MSDIFHINVDELEVVTNLALMWELQTTVISYYK